MDFKRIEWIFIVTFLFLNVFFLYQISAKTQDTFAGSQAGTVDLVAEMENQGITLPKFDNEEYKIPYVQAETNKLLEDNRGELTNQTGTMDDTGLLYVSILSEPIVLSSTENLSSDDVQKINAFLKSSNVLFGKEYEFVRYMPNMKQIIYGQVANNVPIADGTATITFHLSGDKEVISYEQTYAGPVTVQGDSRTLITDKNAVEILYQNTKIAADSKVGKPLLTYYRTLDLDELSMYAPVWSVEVQTGTDSHIEWVDAVSGSVLQDSSSDKQPNSTADSSAEEETKNRQEDGSQANSEE
ncbi:MAG: two-component system regulatory protein YycI [Pisciglobus halotolerans]|nr:two-component system regulatory protein YycI [Pisciglobus halotolerans]